MTLALLVVVARVVLLLTRDNPAGLVVTVPGAVLWASVLLYRVLTATAED